MGNNTFQIIHKGKVVGETSINVQLPDREIKDLAGTTNIVKVNDEGTALMQIRHEFLNVGESIGQVKYSTSAQVTEYGTIKVTQFTQEIASRGEEVWYYKNSTGIFEGTLAEAQLAFPNEDFGDLNVPEPQYTNDPELGRIPIFSNLKPIEWTVHNEFDAERDNGGKPTDWNKWADATQTALDAIGLIPGIGEFADCANGLISLVRGDYADAALSFAAMIPFFGAAATGIKQAKKIKKAKEKVEGVYDLVVKNTDDIQGYIGQSNDVVKRITKHFGKSGKLKETVNLGQEIIHKMKGSTKLEREIYEQYMILKKYGKEWKGLKIKGLINRVNPVGGRYNLKTPQGIKEFYKDAEKVINRFNLQKEFKKL